jgi:hypothetical protein
MEVSDACRLKALKDECRKLKKFSAKAMLDNAMLKAGIKRLSDGAALQDMSSEVGSLRCEAREKHHRRGGGNSDILLVVGSISYLPGFQGLLREKIDASWSQTVWVVRLSYVLSHRNKCADSDTN